VVIPALNEAGYLRATLTQLQATLPSDSEIVVVDDGSQDGSAEIAASFAGSGVELLRTDGLGAARARNYGARRARGELIVFSDAHVELRQGWHAPLAAALREERVGAVAPAIAALGQPERTGYGYSVSGPKLDTTWLGRRGARPYSVPLVSGCFVALRRATFEAIGGFDNSMIGWGWEDTELSMRLWLLGYDVRVAPEVTVAHLFRSKHPYAVSWTGVLHNLLRLALAHFNAARLTRAIEAIKSHADFAAALALVSDGNIWAQRAKLAASRVHDDDWFFHRFGLAC
jgi:glycosyltransferase involved in cell wall biosynthesis